MHVSCMCLVPKALCEAQGVTGYPTLKYYAPGDKEGTNYEGERDLKALKAFAKTLGPQCGPKHLKKCTAEQKASLEGYMALGSSELQAKLAAEQAKLEEAQTKHDTLLKSLQTQFEKSDAELKALKESVAPEIKLMRAAATVHDESDASEAAGETAAKADL